MFKETLVGSITFLAFILGVILVPQLVLLALMVIFFILMSYMIGCCVFETKFGD